jgi:hypothetical protein
VPTVVAHSVNHEGETLFDCQFRPYDDKTLRTQKNPGQAIIA